MSLPRPYPESLHNGDDLANAAKQSRVGRTVADSFTGLSNSLAILGGVLTKRFAAGARAPYELVTATGKSPGSDTVLTAVYAGTGANRAWCLSSVFDHYDETVVTSAQSLRDILPRVTELAANANFVFGDGIDTKPIADAGLNALTLPAWVKQRLRVQQDWASQLKLMRRGTRQEISRILRKQEFASRLTNDHADFEHFYTDLYTPYATRRFSHGVLLVDRQQFIAECRRGIVLQLVCRQSVVGASLLRRVGNTMAIVWSALDPQAEPRDVRGATDALDYFSLLYAHLKGCRWLDFGPSRPDLYDGALRYKSKWGAEVNAGWVPQSAIHVAAGGRHAAENEVLWRHAFVGKVGGELVGVAFIDGDADIETSRSRVAGLRVPGTDSFRIVVNKPMTADARSTIEAIDPRIKIVVAGTFGEAIADIRR